MYILEYKNIRSGTQLLSSAQHNVQIIGSQLLCLQLGTGMDILS
jgi:hypothetical protein